MKYLAERVLTFSDLYQIYIFRDSVQLQDVGKASQKILADISLALFSLTIISNHRGRTIYLTPDDLFFRYTNFPLLSPNAKTWSINLVTLLFNTLPLEL